jgi:hypothetical protein
MSLGARRVGITKSEAIAHGKKVYRSKRTCENGHRSAKFTVNDGCVQCLAQAEARAKAAEKSAHVKKLLRPFPQIDPEACKKPVTKAKVRNRRLLEDLMEAKREAQW